MRDIIGEWIDYFKSRKRSKIKVNCQAMPPSALLKDFYIQSIKETIGSIPTPPKKKEMPKEIIILNKKTSDYNHGSTVADNTIRYTN